MAFTCGLAFAQQSNTNLITMELLEDDIADKLDTGNEENEVLLFGEYFDSHVNFGFGKLFGDSLWFSLYDSYRLFGSNPKKTDSVTNTSYTSDGINTDYTDTNKSASVSGYDLLDNTLDLSMFFNNNAGFTLEWDTDTYFYKGYTTANPTGALSGLNGITTTSYESESTSTGQTSNTKYSKLVNINSTNTYKVKFNGLKFGDDFYFKLNNIALKQESRLVDIAWSTETKNNGSTINGDAQPKYSGKYDYNTFTPSLEVETGLKMNPLWDVVNPEFILVEGFSIAFKKNSNTYNYTTLTTNTAATTVTSSKEYSYDPGTYVNWSNKLTPRFDFDVDLDERLSLKARAQAGITVSGTKEYAWTETTKTTTTTLSNVTGTKTITEVYDKTHTAGQNADTFKVSVDPQFSVGLVYQLVPGKFNVNFGASANSGLFSWTITTNKNHHLPTEHKETYTNQFGETYTTNYSYTVTGNGIPESKSTTFASANPTGDVHLGFTWFLGENAQLDTVVLTGILPASWLFKVQLGMRF